ncbi:MAG: hypothetical protein ACREBG_23590 [Pyrinomonadaceae bacterium]
MTASKKEPPTKEPPRPEGSVESMTEADDGVELTVRLRNPLDRALHYIADVRGMIFDPATRRLRVQLSDQGRELPPGGVLMLPRFRTIDPHSEAVMKVRLPKTILKLASTPSPTGEVVFQEHAVADADEIELDIGWSDTPFYPDPRDKSRATPPVEAWEKESLRTVFIPPKRDEKPYK